MTLHLEPTPRDRMGEAYSAVLNDMRAGGPMSGRGR